MWHALRAELDYYRSYILGGLGLAAGVATLVSVIFYLAGDDGPPFHAAAGIRGMHLLMGPMIVGFIIQGTRGEEKRDRLLLAGPVTPLEIALARALMTVLLFALGLVVAAAVLTGGYLVTGRFEAESLQMVFYVGTLLFAILQLVPLAQEAVAAHGQGRTRAANGAWAFFTLAILLFAALTVSAFVAQGEGTWPRLHLGNLLVALAAMAGGLRLYTGRTDFTR